MNSSNIKIIFFDFDGVLTLDKTGSLSTYRSLNLQTGISLLDLEKVFKPYNAALTLGATTYQEILPWISEQLEFPIDYEMMQQAFASTPINEAMLALARQLGTQYQVGIITDNKLDRMQQLIAQHALSTIFNPIIVSAQIGMAKFEEGIFLYTLEQANIQPTQAIFIDNNHDNLIKPRKLGMHAIHFNDERNDLNELKGMLNVKFNIQHD